MRAIGQMTAAGLATILLAVIATAALPASSEAAEGPFYRVEGVRLAEGTKQTVTAAGTKSFVVTSGAIKVACPKMKLKAEAALLGKKAGTGQVSEQYFEFEGCEVEGNGAGCKLESGRLTTFLLVGFLDYATIERTGTILVDYKPQNGSLFGTYHFVGENCTFKESALEGSMGAQLMSGGKTVQVGSEPAEATQFEVNFPSTPIKTDIFESGGALKEEKISLTAFGKTATVVGAATYEAGKKKLGAYTK